MRRLPFSLRPWIVSLAACTLAACGDDGNGGGASANTCAARAPELLHACVTEVNQAWQSCFSDDGAPCAQDDADIAAALDTLEQGVRAACGDDDFDGLSADGIVGRWRYACRSEGDSLAWRAFGGPQASVWTRSNVTGRACILAAHAAGAAVLEGDLADLNTCLSETSCDPTDAGRHDQRVTAALTEIGAACTIELSRLIALPPEAFLDRTTEQVPCLAAIAHDEPRFALACGPSNALAQPPRGAYQRIVLDSQIWGTQCGDGSPYAFDIRLAPAGHPVDRVVVGLQGGGVCIFNEDCSSRFRSFPGLFTAADDQPPTTGIFSNDPNDSAFANWTKVFLPYCNQDVFIGGGVTQEFDALSLHRYGAVNLRTAMRAVRDIVWQTVDGEGGDGYRPDELIALFGGWSAGGYGTMYNYHWVLDDLLWQRTAAFPDAGLGLDNGGVGVRSLGGTLLPIWNAQPFLPPYCFTGHCAVGPINFAAISPRLKQVPEQQYLIVTNQRDETQSRDAYFSDIVPFINTLRRDYCDTKDLNGIHWYLTSQSAPSQHVVSPFPSFWAGSVDGVAMRDWFADAIDAPDTIGDHAEEGDFTSVLPGVTPFPCEE